MPPPILRKVKGAGYKPNLKSHAAWSKLMLALGVFSAKRQPRSGHSLVSEAGIGRGYFLTLRGERGPVQGELQLWLELAACGAAAARGRRCTPSGRQRPGPTFLTQLKGACSPPATGVTPASGSGFGSLSGPLGALHHSRSLPLRRGSGLRKREPLQPVWEMTSKFDEIILV